MRACLAEHPSSLSWSFGFPTGSMTRFYCENNRGYHRWLRRIGPCQSHSRPREALGFHIRWQSGKGLRAPDCYVNAVDHSLRRAATGARSAVSKMAQQFSSMCARTDLIVSRRAPPTLGRRARNARRATGLRGTQWKRGIGQLGPAPSARPAQRRRAMPTSSGSTPKTW